MIDGHIHIEKGDYKLEWIQQFVDRAVAMELDEIWLLEHNYMFKEFESMFIISVGSNARNNRTHGSLYFVH